VWRTVHLQCTWESNVFRRGSLHVDSESLMTSVTSCTFYAIYSFLVLHIWRVLTLCHSPVKKLLKGAHNNTSKLVVRVTSKQLSEFIINSIRARDVINYYHDTLLRFVGDTVTEAQDTSNEPKETVPQSNLPRVNGVFVWHFLTYHQNQTASDVVVSCQSLSQFYTNSNPRPSRPSSLRWKVELMDRNWLQC
jgi:hypothetical protein